MERDDPNKQPDAALESKVGTIIDLHDIRIHSKEQTDGSFKNVYRFIYSISSELNI